MKGDVEEDEAMAGPPWRVTYLHNEIPRIPSFPFFIPPHTTKSYQLSIKPPSRHDPFIRLANSSSFNSVLLVPSPCAFLFTSLSISSALPYSASSYNVPSLPSLTPQRITSQSQLPSLPPFIPRTITHLALPITPLTHFFLGHHSILLFPLSLQSLLFQVR